MACTVTYDGTKDVAFVDRIIPWILEEQVNPPLVEVTLIYSERKGTTNLSGYITAYDGDRMTVTEELDGGTIFEFSTYMILDLRIVDPR